MSCYSFIIAILTGSVFLFLVQCSKIPAAGHRISPTSHGGCYFRSLVDQSLFLRRPDSRSVILVSFFMMIWHCSDISGYLMNGSFTTISVIAASRLDRSKSFRSDLCSAFNISEPPMPLLPQRLPSFP